MIWLPCLSGPKTTLALSQYIDKTYGKFLHSGAKKWYISSVCCTPTNLVFAEITKMKNCNFYPKLSKGLLNCLNFEIVTTKEKSHENKLPNLEMSGKV